MTSSAAVLRERDANAFQSPIVQDNSRAEFEAAVLTLADGAVLACAVSPSQALQSPLRAVERSSRARFRLISRRVGSRIWRAVLASAVLSGGAATAPAARPVA